MTSLNYLLITELITVSICSIALAVFGFLIWKSDAQPLANKFFIALGFIGAAKTIIPALRYFQYASAHAPVYPFVLTHLSYALDIGAMLCAAFFIYFFRNEKARVATALWIFAIVDCAVMALAAFTNFIFVADTAFSSLALIPRVAVGAAYYYIYIPLVFAHLTWILICIFKRRAAEFNPIVKEKILRFAFGIVIAAITVFIGKVLSVWFDFFAIYDWLGELDIFICAAIFAYTILQRKLFNIRIILVELAVFCIWLFLLIRIFITQNNIDRLVDTILFGLVLIFGFFLLRSVIDEIARKEKLQILGEELKQLTGNLRNKVDEQTKEIRESYYLEKRAKTKLENLATVKNKFLQNINTDMRKKIETFNAHFTDVKRIFEQNPENIIYLEKIARSFERIKALNDELSLIAGAPIAEETFKKINLYQLISEHTPSIRAACNAKKLAYAVQFTGAAQSQYILGEPKSLMTAFMNIADNAIKYTPKGTVSVSGKIIEHPIEQTKAMQISIADTGIGMDADEKKHAFNPFQRGKEAEKLYALGCGIGLNVAKNTILAHGGKLVLESPGRDQGTTITIELPIKNN